MQGFLLAEAVFSVFVTLLVVLTLQGLLQNLRTANRSHHCDNNLAFAYVQFDHFLHDHAKDTVYTLPKFSNHRRTVIQKITSSGKKKEQKEYILEQYHNMLRCTTDEAGHMPLLLNVKRSDFATKDGQIKVELVEGDGRYSELYFL